MKTLEVSESTKSLVARARRNGGEALIITSHGKPLVAVVDLQGLDAESIAVSCNPTFLRILEESRESDRCHGAISSNEMRRRLGIARRKTSRKSKKRIK